MSFLSIFPKNKGEVSFLIDIGNGSICGSITYFEKNKLPIVFFNTRLPFEPTEKPETSRLVDNMNTLLESILMLMMEEVHKNKFWELEKNKVDRVLVSFSSPWFAIKTKHISIINELSFIISQKFIDEIVTKEEDTFKKEFEKNLEKDSTDKFQVIEKSIIHSTINGYTLEESIGKKAKSFDAYVCLSVVSQNIITNLYEKIFKITHVHQTEVSLHSFPVISFGVVRDIFHTSSSFMLMDITGETTDMTLVLNDVISKTTSFPSGRNFIIRQIAKSFDSTLEIAESTLKMYVLKKIDDATSTKVYEILENIEREWSIYLENALLELSPDVNLPNSLYLTSDNDVSGLYQDFLNLPKTDATSVFRKNINVNYVNTEMFSNMIQNKFAGQIDDFSAILTLFYNKIFQK